ncbi:efflux RND transporter periplasmic adaptor subunit [Microbispora sp. ATCC PTA-5024]|uniref:efflux RND transporter periplasmic adaptor subunit n=1 Tax=Microbispora sp. ATCC PTA-5024 TaxID=316330 RepID=UPI0003DBC8E0|nr:efflux RND transporter periplasmic adaptor subunit [Microbispora sp. ATCC PTA-5024]ETK30794.1 membrane protein [Microbispora sp. ATCC PTA-5024]
MSIPPAAPTPTASPTPTPRPSSTACGPQGSQNSQGSQGSQGQGGRGGGAGQGFGGRGGQGGQGGQGGGRQLTEAEAEAQVSKATTDLGDAKDALAGVKIKAPSDGTVLTVAGTVGTHYTSGTFITLGDLSDLEVQAMFTESDVGVLKLGQKATITFATQPGQTYAGEVAHIDPTATTSSRLVRYGVTISLGNRPARLLLGQSASVSVLTGEASDALYVPAQAVRTAGDGTTTVTVRSGGGQVRRTVKVGVRGDRYVEILSGLSDGDQVVLPADAAGGGFPQEGFPGA